MLGSWSLGDYGTTQTLRWGYELLRDGFGRTDLYVTVLDGDEESLRTWQDLGVPVEILGEEDNWWSNGPTGPCGPDSEIFVWTGDGPPTGTPSTDRRWVEIWNHVMMRHRRHPDGSLTRLEQSNVDTGMGLERIVTVLQGKRSVYDTDLFEPWRFLGDRLEMDHLRSSVVVIGEGVRPSNTGHGYVLRRLIRRVLTSQWRLDSDRTLSDLTDEPIEHTLDHFRLDVGVDRVRTILGEEERKFRRLVQRGRPLVDRLRSHRELTEDDLHYLHDTHGLPRDLVLGLLSS
jgi:alanyl-tRNA synthetase